MFSLLPTLLEGSLQADLVSSKRAFQTLESQPSKIHRCPTVAEISRFPILHKSSQSHVNNIDTVFLRRQRLPVVLVSEMQI